MMTENGPCHISADSQTTHPNLFSWTRHANVLWIDLPAPAGFSYLKESTGMDLTNSEIATDAGAFLQGFFTMHPDLLSNKLFVFSESYGGHFAPLAARHILENSHRGLKINLSGVGIGDGMVNPLVQFQFYQPFLESLPVKLKTQLFTPTLRATMHSALPNCTDMIQRCQEKPQVCDGARSTCQAAFWRPFMDNGYYYNVGKKVEFDFSNVARFFASEFTKHQLGVRPASGNWHACSEKIHHMFGQQFMLGAQDAVSKLLEHGIDLLVYAGDSDYVANWMGCKAWMQQLVWSGQDRFNAANDTSWHDPETGSKIGSFRSTKHFTFVKIDDAGHFPAMDQPEATVQMVENFIRGERFS
jgi:carboxypeptidase C (cathepsin A)